MTKRPASGIYYCLIAALLFAACGKAPAPGTVKDEALTVGRMAESFPAADENYFKEMDGGVGLREDDEVVEARAVARAHRGRLS